MSEREKETLRGKKSKRLIKINRNKKKKQKKEMSEREKETLGVKEKRG